jgi:hypothetical protein
LLKAAKYILNEMLMVFILFNCIAVGFSLGLYILYWARPQAQPIASHIVNIVPTAVVLAMALIHFWLMYSRSGYFEHTN